MARQVPTVRAQTNAAPQNLALRTVNTRQVKFVTTTRVMFRQPGPILGNKRRKTRRADSATASRARFGPKMRRLSARLLLRRSGQRVGPSDQIHTTPTATESRAFRRRRRWSNPDIIPHPGDLPTSPQQKSIRRSLSRQPWNLCPAHGLRH